LASWYDISGKKRKGKRVNLEVSIVPLDVMLFDVVVSRILIRESYKDFRKSEKMANGREWGDSN
jgi:hypothetical protein